MEHDLRLTEAERAVLAQRIECRGEVRTAEDLPLSRTSVLRLVAGLPVRWGTLTAARIGLSR
jgi:hypothetical protein